MNSGIHHSNYRVIPAAARGFWVALCKECPAGKQHQSVRSGLPTDAESAVLDHLRNVHGIDLTEEVN